MVWHDCKTDPPKKVEQGKRIIRKRSTTKTFV